jgi:hypothetical protein
LCSAIYHEVLLQYTLSLFLAYPLAAILRQIGSKDVKHLFSFIGGLFLVQWIFEADWIHTFISSFVTYLICALAPRKFSAKIAFVWVMGYMTACHVYRMYVSYLSGIFDFTGTQMVLTMKLTSFAYNYYDGTYDKDKVFATPESQGKDVRMYADRRRFAITKLPNLLEFFGYIYCFTCILAGPAFEYNDYVHSIDGTVFTPLFEPQIKTADGKVKKTTRAPSSLLPAMLQLLIAVVCLVGHIVLSGMYPVSNLYKKEWIAQWPRFFPRLGYMLIALFAERLKFYFAWKVAEGACVLGGFGFEGYDAAGSVIGWKAVENMDIITFETGTNVQTLSRAWNKRTQGWLERYTYLRNGKNLMIVYFVSAFWHGLYPGFFLLFMTLPLLTNIERLIRAKINPIIVPEYDGRDINSYPRTAVGKIYWVVCWFLTQMSANYVVQVVPFIHFASS